MPTSAETLGEADLFPRLLEQSYESLHFFADAPSGLRAVIAIHSTALGPSLGGTRALSTYRSESEAVTDVLRLARGMTYKAALCGSITAEARP